MFGIFFLMLAVCDLLSVRRTITGKLDSVQILPDQMSYYKSTKLQKWNISLKFYFLNVFFFIFCKLDQNKTVQADEAKYHFTFDCFDYFIHLHLIFCPEEMLSVQQVSNLAGTKCPVGFGTKVAHWLGLHFPVQFDFEKKLQSKF